jgi:transposase
MSQEEKKELVQSEEKKKVINRIDVQKALKLRLQGNSFSEIGTIFGVSPQAVEQRLDGFKEFLSGITDIGQLESYTEERKSILNAAEMTLLRSVLDEEAIKKAPLAARTMAFGVLYDKRRLEEGKSTENLGILGKLIVESEGELGAENSGQSRLRVDRDASKKGEVNLK